MRRPKHDGQNPAGKDAKADLLHLAPVMGEVSLSEWRGRARFVGIGLQGWLRRPASEPGPGVAVIPGAAPMLRGIDAVALSEDDLVGHDGLLDELRRSVRFVAVTRSEHGALIYERGQVRGIPAVNVDEVDPTGAGDTFAAAWFAGLASGQSAVDSAVSATQFAAACVGVIGVPSVEDLVA